MNATAHNYLVEARAISKRFGKVVALDRVNLSIPPAKVVALLGDNGSGKSTLIKIISGAILADAGELLWDGLPVHLGSARDAIKLGISVVYQDLSIIDHMSVWRNIFLGREEEVTQRLGPLRLLDVSRARSLAAAAVDDIGIRLRSVDQPVVTLSGGERQSVAIARAVHFESRLLILDEPTAALSLHETEKVLEHIAQARARGVSVIVITHDVQHVFPLADRFTVLAHGRSIADLGQGEASVAEISRLITGGVNP